jgi:hypothetical protein
VSSDFSTKVRDLPLSGDDLAPYTNFIDYFGTHFVTEATMGAKLVIESEVKIPTIVERSPFAAVTIFRY